MELKGNSTPDESTYSEDSISSLGTMPNSDIFSSPPEQYQHFRERYRSLLGNNRINIERLFELSPESTQHNDDCSKKLDSIINSQAEISRLLKDLIGSILSERNEQNENIITMNEYLDKKVCQASAAYRNVHSTLMHIKDATDATENKLNAHNMKFEGFIKNDVPELKQILDEFATKNRVIEEMLHKLDVTLNLKGVLLSNAVKTEELARNLNDTNNRIKTVENLLMDVKIQLDNIEKALVTLSVQQHYSPNRSFWVAPQSVVPISKEHLEQQNENLLGKEGHSKKNAAISATASDVYKSDNDFMTIGEVFQYPQFIYQQNIPIVQENDGNTEGKLCVSDPKKTITEDNYKCISQAFTSDSTAQRPATQQNRQGKKRDSKESNLNAPPENAISTEVSGQPLHCRPNIRMPRENTACNSPSIPPTSGGIEPYCPLKRAKSRILSEEHFK